ncbi:MAG TPA: chemotaxis protein CheW [Nitrospiraceae bacterium]|nr:chemotaxis protein CheW [Nitrospiraceae bacterium]
MTEVLGGKNSDHHGDRGQQYVTFSLNDETYAVPASRVQEIIELGKITPVPHLPVFLKGVINLRGIIVPVVDLKLKFGIDSPGYKKHTCVVVMEFSTGIAGLIVDAVSDVFHLPEQSIAKAPSLRTPIPVNFISGIGEAGHRLILLLDVDAVLSCEESSILAGARGVSRELH